MDENQIDKFKKAGKIFAVTSVINMIIALASYLSVGADVMFHFGPILDFYQIDVLSDKISAGLSLGSILFIGLTLAYFIHRGNKIVINVTILFIVPSILVTLYLSFFYLQYQSIGYRNLYYFFISQAILIKLVQTYYLVDALYGKQI